jgi:hypothetical protein
MNVGQVVPWDAVPSVDAPAFRETRVDDRDDPDSNAFD